MKMARNKNNPGNHLFGSSTTLRTIRMDASYTLFWHDPNPKSSWDDPSYENLGTLRSVREVGGITRALKDFLGTGMFFLMRDSEDSIPILPKWESYPKGGCISIKVCVEDAYEVWADSVFKLIKSADSEPNYVGVSIANKGEFALIRLWVSEEKELDISDIRHNGSTPLYKPHRDSMSGKKLFSSVQWKKGERGPRKNYRTKW